MTAWRRACTAARAAAGARWLPDYLLGRLRPRAPAGRTRHILFLFADHWEPGAGDVSEQAAAERARDWARLYPQAARGHRDADGRSPRHSFFYPFDQFRDAEASLAAGLCRGDYGEAEIHLHHRHDTAASLARKLESAVARFRRHGFLGSHRGGRPGFAFIHGDWSLDNSRRGEGRCYCGVDEELRVLAEAGCYMDLTFPALGHAAQPRWANRIVRAADDPRPRSYDRGVEARVGVPPSGDLLLLPGPLALHWPGGRLRLDDGQVTGGNGWRPDRVDAWVRAGVQVRGRPEWVFVKVHSHGCTDRNRIPLLTRELERIWTDLESRYNDGQRYRLHYVTAREAYNIIRAAEDGRAGDPGRYRDYEIAPPPLLRKWGADVAPPAASAAPTT